MRFRAHCLASIAFAVYAIPALAHHSFSMFDQTQFMNLTGTVTEFEWINPHAWLHAAVTDESGSPETWSFEGGNLGGLAAAGWRADSVAAGEQVEIGFNPMIDGARGGQLRVLVLPDGTILCNVARFCDDSAEAEAAY